MEAAPSVKQRRGLPPIPPNYVSLRQLQELRLKEEEEKRQREEAAHKAEMEAMAAAAVKRDAARKPESKVSAVVSATPVRAKERRQWVAVAHRPAVSPPPPRGEVVLGMIGVGRGNKGPVVAPRDGGKPEGKANGDGKKKVSAITRAQTRTDEPGKPAEASSHDGKPENKGEGEWKKKEKASGDTSADRGSIGGSGESVGASSRRRNNPKGKKGAGGRYAEPSPAGASPPQGVKPEDAGKPKSPGPKLADACDPSHRKKTDARPAPPTSAGVGSVGELRTTAESKPEDLVEGHRRPPLVEDQGVAKQKPRVLRRRACPRPPGDRCNGAGEQRVRVWVPKAAAGCAEL